MKKIYKILTAVTAASAIAALSGCAGFEGCAGCGGNATMLVPLNSNWYANVNYKKIQPTFIEGNDNFGVEELVYKVTHDKETAFNTNYSVDYAEGTYTTLFKAVSFDKTKLTHESFAGGYPDGVTAYYYKTELSIPSVTYTLGGESRTLTGDKVVTECYFLPVEDFLRPLYSRESIKSSTPAEMQAGSVDEAYRVIDLDITTYYSYDGNTALTVTADGENKTEKTVDGINSAANTCFDVASLNIAVRANRLGADLNQSVSLYTPAAGVGNYLLKGSSGGLSEEEDAKIRALLVAEGLYAEEKNDDGSAKALDATSVAVNYGGALGGVSQVYTFASVKNPTNNVGRATLLKLSTPLSYSLGTLNYTLDSVAGTLYKG